MTRNPEVIPLVSRSVDVRWHYIPLTGRTGRRVRFSRKRVSLNYWLDAVSGSGPKLCGWRRRSQIDTIPLRIQAKDRVVTV
jgi:hypothetical protein